MHTMKLLVLIACLAALSACARSVPPAEVEAKTTAEVKAAVATLVEGYRTRDVSKVVGVNAPDHLGMGHGAPDIVGPEAELASVKAQLADPATKLSLDHEHIEAGRSGDLAIYRAVYHFTYTDPATKTPVTETGNWMVLFKRQPDGTLKLQWEVMSDLPSHP